MEFQIDDLLCGVNVDYIVITTRDFASMGRVKNLALSKANSVSVGYRRRPLSIGVIAAVLAVFLVTTALAAILPDVLHTIDIEYPISSDGQALPSEVPDWGIEFCAYNIRPTGMELVCVSSGGDYSGQLMTGNHFYIETKTDSGWETVPRMNEEYVWQWVCTEISGNETYTWSLDWSDIYGELPPGVYRLRKPVWEWNNNQAGQYVEYSAEFIIGGEESCI